MSLKLKAALLAVPLGSLYLGAVALVILAPRVLSDSAFFLLLGGGFVALVFYAAYQMLLGRLRREAAEKARRGRA